MEFHFLFLLKNCDENIFQKTIHVSSTPHFVYKIKFIRSSPLMSDPSICVGVRCRCHINLKFPRERISLKTKTKTKTEFNEEFDNNVVRGINTVVNRNGRFISSIGVKFVRRWNERKWIRYVPIALEILPANALSFRSANWSQARWDWLWPSANPKMCPTVRISHLLSVDLTQKKKERTKHRAISTNGIYSQKWFCVWTKCDARSVFSLHRQESMYYLHCVWRQWICGDVAVTEFRQ